MGFLTIWFFLISTFFVFSFLIKKYPPFKTFYFSVFSYLLLAISTFFAISFTYQEFFLYYLLIEAKTPFYISDLNLLAFHLFRNIGLFSSAIFFPFVVQGVFMCIKPFLSQDETRPRCRFAYLIIYIHIVSLGVTHLDLFKVYRHYFTYSSSSWFEGIDYNSFINIYWGTYYDLYLAFLSPWLLIDMLNERHYLGENSRYNFDVFYNNIIGKTSYFWSAFYSFWRLRAILHIINLYFFIGGGLTSDIHVIVTAFFSIELFLFFHRLMISLNAWSFL